MTDLRGIWDETGLPSICFDDLVERYNEPHRHYHTVKHMTAVVEFIWQHRMKCDDWRATLIAGFYHDAIYDPKSAVNEEASAVLAVFDCAAVPWSFTVAHRVLHLILTTAGHAYTTDPDAQVLADADLVGFATLDPYEVSKWIRAEYEFVPDNIFWLNRYKVLQHYGGRKPFYYICPKLETAAIENIGIQIKEAADFLRAHGPLP